MLAQTAPLYRQHLADLPGPTPIPLLGNMLQIKRGQFHVSLEQWAQKYGPQYQIKMSGQTWLVLSDPNIYSKLLRDRPDSFSRLRNTVRGIEEIVERGVFTAEGEEWRKQRKLVMRALTPEVIQRFFPQLQLMTKRLLLRWETQTKQGQGVNLLRDLKAFTLDVTLALAFGQDINTLEQADNPLQHDIEFIFMRMAKRMTNPIKYWRHFRLPVDRATDAAAARIAKAIDGFIAASRKKLDQHAELRLKPSNLMEALIVARDEPGSEFNDSHVSGNAMTMVFAGEDTTSNSLAWLIDALAQAPDCVADIRRELDTLDGRVLAEYGHLQQVPQLDAAIQESLRLKPAAPFMGIETTRELVSNEVLLPANTPIVLLLRQAGMQENIFPQAQRFLPSRWLQGDGQEHELSRKLFTFGGGPRLCPGRFLALVEIKMLAAMLVKNFELEKLAGKAEEVFAFTMTPSCLPVNLKLRQAQ